MITRVSSVIRPKGSDLIFDHPYNAESARLAEWWAMPVLAHRSPNSERLLTRSLGSVKAATTSTSAFGSGPAWGWTGLSACIIHGGAVNAGADADVQRPCSQLGTSRILY